MVVKWKKTLLEVGEEKGERNFFQVDSGSTGGSWVRRGWCGNRGKVERGRETFAVGRAPACLATTRHATEMFSSTREAVEEKW